MIHLTVEQHLTRLRNKPQPKSQLTRHRQGPSVGRGRPTKEPTTKECSDGKHGSRSVRNHMQVGGFEVEVLVVIAVAVRLFVSMR